MRDNLGCPHIKAAEVVPRLFYNIAYEQDYP